MATILDFDSFGDPKVLPRFWVDTQASTARIAPLQGWVRDLAAVAEVLFADDVGAPDLTRVRWVCDQTRQYAASVGGKATFAFRLGLGATTWIAPLMVAKVPPLRRLSFTDRVRALERYERSPLGLSVFAVKVFLSISWFEHPEVAREVNFDGGDMGVYD